MIYRPEREELERIKMSVEMGELRAENEKTKSLLESARVTNQMKDIKIERLQARVKDLQKQVTDQTESVIWEQSNMKITMPVKVFKELFVTFMGEVDSNDSDKERSALAGC